MFADIGKQWGLGKDELLMSKHNDLFYVDVFSSQVSFEDWVKINGYKCRLSARRVTTTTDHHYYPMRPDIEEESK